MDDMVAEHFKAGEVIFKEGDPPGAVYLINQGEVLITKDKVGEAVTLAKLGWNSIFGEMALIDKKKRSATATAVKDTWCYKLDQETFQKKLNELDPFMRGICQVLVQIARTMTDKYPYDLDNALQPARSAAAAQSQETLIDSEGRAVPRAELPMIDLEPR